MAEYHVKRITLPSGKQVELLYLLPDAAPTLVPVEIDPAADAAHTVGAHTGVRRVEVCPNCGSDRVHPTDWAEVDDRHWQLDVRCPDCRWRATEVYDEAEVERYDDVLNDGTDALIADLERITQENMSDHLARFTRALESDGIMPIDF
jgi:hypothetical protein